MKKTKPVLTEKACTKCSKVLPLDSVHFNKQKGGFAGFNAQCKACIASYNKKQRSTAEYKVAAAKRQAKWRKNNPEKEKNIMKKCRDKYATRNNAARNWKYHNDPVFRAKKDTYDKARIKSGVNNKAAFTEEAWAEHLAKRRKYCHDNPDVVHKYVDNNREELADPYVKNVIARNMERQVGMKPTHNEIPQDLVELKRKQLKLYRDVKKTKKWKNNSTD